MPRARYKSLVDSFAKNIRLGHLSPGSRLPTHRQLADRENIALVTATRVYAELESMGLVSREVGRGTFVRETALPLGHGIDQTSVPEGMIDLNFNSSALPQQTALLRKTLRELSCSGDLETLLHYQPHAGRKHERVIVANYLASRGVQADGEQTLIVSGAQHGLAITVMTLLQPGDVVAVDALTYPGFKILAEVYHLELVPIPITAQGPDLCALEKQCQSRNIKAVYSIPTLHNPMGWVINDEQRQQLVSLARKHDLIIIEDAAYACLEENAPSPLITLAPERTVYISGFSKSIATGLRVGFVLAPLQWITLFERTIRATTWNTPSLMTSMVCKWIEDNTVVYLEAEKRRDAMARQVIAKNIFKEIPYMSHPASYFIWVPLPEEVRADQVVMALMDIGISVSTAEAFATSKHIPHALRLALGSVELRVLQVALEKVRQTIDHFAYGLNG